MQSVRRAVLTAVIASSVAAIGGSSRLGVGLGLWVSAVGGGGSSRIGAGTATRKLGDPVGHDPIRVCELLVGLGEVGVVGVDDEGGRPLGVRVRCRSARPACGLCGGLLWSVGERPVELVDLPALGRPVVLVWHKRRWRRPDGACVMGSVTEQNCEIASWGERLTTRAGRWAMRRVGRGRPVKDVASELGCGWRTVNASVRRWGCALLEADTRRVSAVEVLGLDETLFCRRGRFGAKAWPASIVDAGSGQLLGIVPGRTAEEPARWLSDRPQHWREGVRWAALGLSGPYRAAFDAALPHARQVADPFHVIRLADNALDDVRRRVQNQTLGHRGRKADPLCRARKLLASAHERITVTCETKPLGLLDAGGPRGGVRNAWHAKETLRGICGIADPGLGAGTVDRLAVEFCDNCLPPEINRLGRTIWRWRRQISNWHHARVSNAATETVDNLIKRVKRVAFE